MDAQWRMHIEFNGNLKGIALWAPWRPPHRPLIYAFWRDGERVF